MRKELGWLAMGAAVAMIGTNARGAEVNADLAALSAYGWRGQVLNDEPVAQPALNLAGGGFGVNVWGNVNLTDNVTDDPDFSELDLTVSYGGRLGPAAYGAGLVEYVFPNTDVAGTREIYACLSLPGAPVVPCLTVYRDIDEADGFYGSFSLARTVALAEKAALALGASLGAGDGDYNAFYFGVDDAALNDATLTASVAVALTDRVTLTPGLQYTWLPDPDIRGAADDGYGDDNLWTGFLKLNVVL